MKKKNREYKASAPVAVKAPADGTFAGEGYFEEKTEFTIHLAVGDKKINMIKEVKDNNWSWLKETRFD